MGGTPPGECHTAGDICFSGCHRIDTVRYGLSHLIGDFGATGLHADLLEHVNAEAFVTGIGFAEQGLDVFENHRFELCCGGLFSGCLG